MARRHQLHVLGAPGKQGQRPRARAIFRTYESAQHTPAWNASLECELARDVHVGSEV